MKNTLLMRYTLFLFLFVAFAIGLSSELQASSLFGAPEIVNPGDLAIGLNGEALLSTPPSEGVELRVKYGVTPSMNSEIIVGPGSDHRKFRVGVQNVFSVFPDMYGQFGVSAILSGLYLRRAARSVAVLTAGPMIHERVNGAIPLNFYFAWPFEIEFDRGRYFTGSQLVFGAVGGLGQWFMSTDLGLGFAGRESYLALGVGCSFGRAPATGE